jgi:hypothetical protein
MAYDLRRRVMRSCPCPSESTASHRQGFLGRRTSGGEETRSRGVEPVRRGSGRRGGGRPRPPPRGRGEPLPGIARTLRELGEARRPRNGPAAVARKAGKRCVAKGPKETKCAGQGADWGVFAGQRILLKRIPKPRVAGSIPAGGTGRNCGVRWRLSDLSSFPPHEPSWFRGVVLPWIMLHILRRSPQVSWTCCLGSLTSQCFPCRTGGVA